MSNSILAQLPSALIPWYETNKRDLPWRHDRSPYHIWISEIMLQQTRVEAVKGYYDRFLSALPTISDLAACDDDSLHKLWEGLGYYSRVRNLKKAAQIICSQYGSKFPETYDQILALPGIGEYTAGAISSIAFNLAVPAVDGNVLRLIARLTDDNTPIDDPKTKASVRNQLLAVYPQNAGTFTQALMELGATLCGPNRAPECGSCPCQDFCLGFRHGTAEKLPVKSPKKGKKQEDRTVFVFSCNGRYALQKRPSKGLLASMWQFPNTSGKLETQDAISCASALGLTPAELYREIERKHIFTHIVWNMRGIYMEVRNPVPDFQWFTADEINAQAALPTAFRIFWEELHV